MLFWCKYREYTRLKIIRINVPWIFLVFTLLIPFSPAKINWRIIPSFNVVDAATYAIVGPLHDILFEGEETVSKKESLSLS